MLSNGSIRHCKTLEIVKFETCVKITLSTTSRHLLARSRKAEQKHNCHALIMSLHSGKSFVVRHGISRKEVEVLSGTNMHLISNGSNLGHH